MKVKVLAMFFLLPLFCSAQITMDDDCFDRSNSWVCGKCVEW